MKQKIEWYREVLELEPNSKVFFPLARLEAGDSQPEAAIATLRQGLARHPDHIEARLLLVDLLHQTGREAELLPEVDSIGKLLGAYQGFWSAWSTRLAQTPETADAALALRFLAAGLDGRRLSWNAVIQQGLQSILQDGAPAVPAPVLSAPRPEESLAESVREKAVFLKADEPPHLPEPEFAAGPEPYGPAGAGFYEEDEGDGEEAFSLKTRSMAEVLAEQGDYAGALAIYAELKANAASSKAEEKNLAARMEELRALMSNPVEEAASEAEDDLRAATGKNRLLDVLESLAQRLEAKARI